MFSQIVDYTLYAITLGGVVALLAAQLRAWRPHRLLEHVPLEAALRSRCVFGGGDWFQQGVAYLLDGALILTDGRNCQRSASLSRVQRFHPTLQFPAVFSERLHGFTFVYEGETLWFAVPDYRKWEAALGVRQED